MLLMGRPKKPPTETCRLHSDVAKLARIAAAAVGKQLPDYLSDRLRPLVEQDVQEFAQAVKRDSAKKK